MRDDLRTFRGVLDISGNIASGDRAAGFPERQSIFIRTVTLIVFASSFARARKSGVG